MQSPMCFKSLRLSAKEIMTQFNLASFIWIIMPVVIIGLGIGIISTSIFLAQHAEDDIESDSHNTQKIQIELIKERAIHLFKVNESIHNTAGIIGSIIDNESTSSTSINTNVASCLFLAFNTIPLASQISYITANEVIFSYLHEKDQTRVMFSNTSSKSLNSTFHQWYSQKVDHHTGKEYGDVVSVSQIQLNDSLWLSDALKGRSRSPSYGYGWGYHRHAMLFFTAQVDRLSVVALGIRLKDFINYILLASFPDTWAYVFTKDDIFVVNNINNLKTVQLSDFLPLKGIISDSCYGVIDSQLFTHSSSKKQLITMGGKNMLYCAPINIAEIHMVIVMGFPVKDFLLNLQEMKVIIALLLSFYVLVGFICSCISSKLFRGLQRDKLLTLANLIKQKDATQQAERKSMNKSIAFSSASHDIRASLAGITGLINLWRVDVPSNSVVAKNLEMMDSCASKLLGILNSVLDISKVEAGKMQLEDLEFNIAQAIEESVDIFYVIALEKGLEVIWDPCDFSVFKSSNVRGDCRRFKQILDNLLSNAVKFTSNGHVIVRAWAKKVGSKDLELSSIQHERFFNAWTCLSRCFCYFGGTNSDKSPSNSFCHCQGDMEFIFEVDDTGSGIPKDRRDIVFENYVQLNGSTLGREGTGLGLGIVQSYVRLMGGDIAIKEKQPGARGSCFMFNIFLKFEDVSLSSNEEGFDGCKLPILNRLHSSSSKTRANVLSNNHALAISQDVVTEGVLCLLAIHGGETRRILKDWMKTLGITVSVAQQPEHVFSVLQRMISNGSASGSQNSSLSSSVINSEYSSPRDENRHVLPLSIKDVSKKASLKGSTKYLLVIVDLCFGNFYDIQNISTFIAKTCHHFHQYKVICLTDSTSSYSHLQCDLMLHKPLHGSRFFKILELIQEFRQPKCELKLQVARESCGSELETKTLLKSANSQQNSSVLVKDDNAKLPLSGMKILLVEDTVLLCQIALKVLAPTGAIVRFVNDGLEAFNLVKETLKETSHISDGCLRHLPFDVILMDCQMPVMDGYEATKCIRAEEKKYGIYIPIFALSAHAEPEEAKKSLLCGMDAHLTKPIEVCKLLEAIHSFSK